MRDEIPIEKAQIAILRCNNCAKIHRSGRNNHSNDDQPHRDFIGNHLRCRAQGAEKGIFRVGGPTAHNHPINFERRHCENKEQGHIDIGQNPGRVEGDNGPSQHRQNKGHKRRQYKDRTICARRNDNFLYHIFQGIGHGLQQAKQTHHIWPTPHLNRSPDFPVAIDQKQQADHHKTNHRKGLAQKDHCDPEVCGKEFVHTFGIPRSLRSAALIFA